MSETVTLANPPELDVVALRELPESQLRMMLSAGEDVQECHRVLKKAGLNVVGEVLKNQGQFVQFNHYPKGDVYDKETFSQYYYHAHRGIAGENGHFHTFLRGGGFADAVEPVPYDGDVKWPSGKDAVTHYIAISMDKYGFAMGLFATNRWVTDETLFSAEDMLSMLDSFAMDHAYPSWPTNLWLTRMFVSFRPEIEALLLHRDMVLTAWREEFPDKDVYEDRALEVTGELRISVQQRLTALQDLLR